MASSPAERRPLPSVIILGSGPSAAGAAIALASRPGVDVTIIDIGTTLEEELGETVDRLAKRDPAEWAPDDVARVSRPHAGKARGGLPEKRIFSSDYPFRDLGQLRGISAGPGVNTTMVSSAFGGFSTVWGAQVMPFSKAILRDWPIDLGALYSSYKAVLSAIPFVANDDDLSRDYPLYAQPRSLPLPSARARDIIGRYERNRSRVNRHGFTLGQARVAADLARCVRCGLCHTGCPYSLIYSSRDTVQQLQREGRLRYRSGWNAELVGEEGGAPYVVARCVRTGERQRFSADAVLVG